MLRCAGDDGSGSSASFRAPRALVRFAHSTEPISLHKDAPVTLVRAYENAPEFRWEIAVGMRKSDDALVTAINEAVDRLLADGTVGRIYASYGIEPSLPKGK